ncbi:MAG: hypothetical protein OES38_03495 [Gammaproteobacteria bacterium]|nr:hypothetical protein [Gammaproteobacteria bacterium]
MAWKRIVVSLMFLFGSGLGIAEEAPLQHLSVTAIDVNPGGQAAFEAFLSKYKAAVDKVGGDATWGVSTNALGPARSYTISAQMPGFAGLATPPDPFGVITEAFGEEEAQAAAASLQGAVAGTHGRAWRALPALSVPGDNTNPPVGFTVLFIDVAGGEFDDFMEYSGKIAEAARQVGDRNYVSFAGMAGAPSDILVTLPILSWEQLDTPPPPIPALLNQAFGEREGARIYEKGVGSIANIESTMLRTRPDLSRPPAN